MIQNIQDTREFDALLEEKDAILAYFSTTECSVCKVLKPKVAQMIQDFFPEMTSVFIEMNETPQLAAQNSVFTAPTVVVFFAGKEYIRKSRSFSLDELKSEIERIYSRMFS